MKQGHFVSLPKIAKKNTPIVMLKSNFSDIRRQNLYM